LEDEDGGVRQRRDLDLALSDADGLDEDEIEEMAQQPRHGERAATDATEIALRRLRAEEDATLADRKMRAQAVAEERAARLGARRIDREDGDARLWIGSQQLEREAADQGRLPGARRAGDADDPRAWRPVGARSQVTEERGTRRPSLL